MTGRASLDRSKCVILDPRGAQASGQILITATTMSIATTGQGSSISQHLRTTKEILQDAIFGSKYVQGGGIP